MRWIFVLVLASVLAGCGLARMQQEAEWQAKQDAEQQRQITDCNQKYSSSTRREEASRMACDTDVLKRFFPPNLGRIADLYYLQYARSVEIARRFDDGQLSYEQYQLELARSASDRQEAINQRDNNAALAYAATRPRQCVTNANASGGSYNGTTTCY